MNAGRAWLLFLAGISDVQESVFVALTGTLAVSQFICRLSCPVRKPEGLWHHAPCLEW